MRVLKGLTRITLLVIFGFAAISVLFVSAGAASSPPVLGNNFEEVVKLAKKEGKVSISGSLGPKEVKVVLAGFYKAYPQIEVEYLRQVGIAAREKTFTEALAGHFEFDAIKVIVEMRRKYIDAGLLAGPLEWKRFFPNTPEVNISPNGYFAGSSFFFNVIAYNPNLVPAERVPRTWEDCLDPYWKGRFAVDVRPSFLSALYHPWGEQRVLEYAKKLVANSPVWKEGQDEIATQVAAGEYPLFVGPGYSTVDRLLKRDPRANIRAAFPAVVPVKLNEAFGILKGAKNPNAAFLLAGWLASEEAMRGYDKVGRGSPFLEGTESWNVLEKAGAKAAFAGWDEEEYVPPLSKKIISIWGFPAVKK